MYRSVPCSMYIFSGTLHSPYIVHAEYVRQSTFVGAGGHVVWTLVSTSYSLLLTMSPLVAAYFVRLGSPFCAYADASPGVNSFSKVNIVCCILYLVI